VKELVVVSGKGETGKTSIVATFASKKKNAEAYLIAQMI